MSALINLQENPIFIAVSILSPVRTHTLIPDLINPSMVSPTSSYNLSSIAVAPTIARLTSSSSYKTAIFSSLSTNEEQAC